MANSEKGKQKILVLYNYFLKQVNDYDEGSAKTMADIIAYLEEVTGSTFERKSISADIARINEFMRDMNLVTTPGSDWIYREGQKYMRSEVRMDLTLDEARLLVDAIRTTPFVNTDLCMKIEAQYPLYFKNGYKSLVTHDSKISQRTRFLLNTIRNCIEESSAFSFKYGYQFAGGLRNTSDKVVSPLALDWEDSNYYLIAVDNSLVESGHDNTDSIRRYRIDRIELSSYKRAPKTPYYGFMEDKDKVLDKYIKASVHAYAGNKSKDVIMTIKCEDEKVLVRAYSAFDDDIKIKRIIDDKLSKGYVKFIFEAGIKDDETFVPTIFPKLFMLYTFDGVTIDIEDEQMSKQLREYLIKALG